MVASAAVSVARPAVRSVLHLVAEAALLLLGAASTLLARMIVATVTMRDETVIALVAQTTVT